MAAPAVDRLVRALAKAGSRRRLPGLLSAACLVGMATSRDTEAGQASRKHGRHRGHHRGQRKRRRQRKRKSLAALQFALSSPQQIPSGLLTKVRYDLSSNPDVLDPATSSFLAPISGHYFVVVSVSWQAFPADQAPYAQLETRIMRNDTVSLATADTFLGPGGTVQLLQALVTLRRGARLAVFVAHNAGMAIAVASSAMAIQLVNSNSARTAG